MTSSQTAALFIASQEAKHRKPLSPKAECAARVRQAVLSCIGRLTVKWSPQIADEATDLLGEEVQVRVVQRLIRKLIGEGLVRETADGYLLVRERAV